MIKQIFRTGKGIELHQVPKPTPGDKEILVQVVNSVISTGTETMGMRRGDVSFMEQLKEKAALLNKVTKTLREKGAGVTIQAIKTRMSPGEQAKLMQPIGYSNTGIVVGKGQFVDYFNVGDRVACAGSGIASHSEYVTVPINLAVKVPEGVDITHAAFTTIGAIAMQGIRRANITFGETIVITGLGLLGLLAVQIAKAWGLVVIGTDINENRLDLALKLGADHCINADRPDLLDKIKSITNNRGADAVIIYAGTSSSEPANLALKVCRSKGRVVVVGAIGMELEREYMYTKELDFVMSTSYGPGRYDEQYEVHGIDYPIGYVRWTENRNMQEFLRLIKDDEIDINSLISNVYRINEYREAYEALVTDPANNIACVFKYDDQESINASTIETFYGKSSSPIDGRIGVGIIGAGSFIKKNHLINILSLPDYYELISIANKTPASAKALGQQYNLKYTTDYNDLLTDNDINLIVIGTRHNLHAEQVIKAINAGKNVLVEKPLAMSYEEIEQIVNAYIANSELVLCVGFNRRYSPLTQKALEILRKHNEPRVITYRVNAGYLPDDIWIQKLSEGGGRIVGEVCHFVDLISYLAESNLKSIGAIHIPVSTGSVNNEDNVIVSLAFENGSIGVLTYTAIGASDMEKERIEIFSNNQSIVIVDFKELRYYNCEGENLKLKVQDKGHKGLILELAKHLKGDESLILPFSEDIKTTKMTLDVLDIIHSVK